MTTSEELFDQQSARRTTCADHKKCAHHNLRLRT
jgi:hypothetical protein